MRRKSTRNASKAQEKPKPAEQPTRKSRRTSKRRRKSTSSESEKSEEEQELSQMAVAEDEKVTSDSEAVNSTIDEDAEKGGSQIVERKTRRSKTTSSPIASESKVVEEGNENKSRNSNRLRQREMTKPEDDADGEGIADKGKSKGKTRAKVEHEPTDASGTVTESEICTNAQVTPLSPQTDIDYAVTCESIVTQSAADSVNDKSPVDQEPDCTRSDDQNDDNDVVESSVDVVDSSTNDNVINLDIKNNDIQRGEGDMIPIKSPVCIEQTEQTKIVDASNDGTEERKEQELESIKASESEKSETLQITKNDESSDTTPTKHTGEKMEQPDQNSENNQNDVPSPKEDEYCVPMDVDKSESSILETISTDLTKEKKPPLEEPYEEQKELKSEEKIEKSETNPSETSEVPIRQQEQRPEETKLKTQERKMSVQKIRIKRTSTLDETNEAQPKRRWGKGFKFTSGEIIDSNVVMNVYPDVQFLKETEVKLEHTESKTRRYSTAESGEDKSDRRVSLDFERQTSEESFKTEVEHEEKTNIIAFNRKISIIDDSATTLKPPPSPAKNPISDTLFITNLVRPFTLKQLRELLERTGKIKEDGFWTDRIKSKCYIQYESEEEARGTREALHGVHWPIGNGKKLIIDYTTEEELTNAKNPPAPPPPAPVVLEPSKSDKENEDLHRTKKEDRKSKERDEKETRRREHVREWDVGKEDIPHKSKSDHEHHDRRKHSRRSSTPRDRDDYLAKKRKKVEDQIPQKLMDDLFQKTTATPSIYWQPLTPEEIATKQQQRLERMAEHKKRMEETSTRPRMDYGRGGPYRRKYD